ncbi:DNA-binding transcriptional regulator BolA [Diorhabda sublineata]|uniref:DNA-binding transcriptional regulator BolA n=1 Tax=Diorhabda sublineata TaxID=1163346 RepID=UPI0024E06C99|nr:DNA-binding transcriptional regulator BolA [Diorhabda sublineata]
MLKVTPNISTMTKIAMRIQQKLQTHLEAQHLQVINESYMHNVPKGSETHFKVVVVSNKFTNVPLIKRHRAITDVLKEELNNGVHALSVEARTPEEWEKSTKSVQPSPSCLGGFGK